MSNKFAMTDYVDVATRLVEFREKHPEGSLQPAILDAPYVIEIIGDLTFVVYTAAAYRTPDDPRPGIGCAWEPFPGRTPYTKNSELMNAETSAWGRAILAVLAADARKGIASAEEVRNRAAEPTSAPRARPQGNRRPAPQDAPNGDPRPSPPCDKCGGSSEPNPAHAKNDRAPEFRCTGSCEDVLSDGRAFRHGISYATEGQIRASGAALGEWATEVVDAGESATTKEALEDKIRPVLINVLGLPETRRAWSRAHASKLLDAWDGDRAGMIKCALDGGTDDITW